MGSGRSVGYAMVSGTRLILVRLNTASSRLGVKLGSRSLVDSDVLGRCGAEAGTVRMPSNLTAEEAEAVAGPALKRRHH